MPLPLSNRFKCSGAESSRPWADLLPRSRLQLLSSLPFLSRFTSAKQLLSSLPTLPLCSFTVRCRVIVVTLPPLSSQFKFSGCYLENVGEIVANDILKFWIQGYCFTTVSCFLQFCNSFLLICFEIFARWIYFLFIYNRLGDFVMCSLYLSLSFSFHNIIKYVVHFGLSFLDFLG